VEEPRCKGNKLVNIQISSGSVTNHKMEGPVMGRRPRDGRPRDGRPRVEGQEWKVKSGRSRGRKDML
jgi:hypothetical protein